MSTEIIRPTGVGTNTGLTASDVVDNYTCVDEDPSNEATDFVSRAPTSYATDTYQMGNPTTIGVGDTINKITIYCHCKRQNAGYAAYAKTAIYMGTTLFVGTEQTIASASFDYYSEIWTQNPNTTSAWTLTDLQNLEAGVSLKGGGTGKAGVCTQVYVEIDFTAAPTATRACQVIIL